VRIACSHCQQSIEYSTVAPKYCSHCGRELTDTHTELADAETLIGADDPPTVALTPADQGVLGPYVLESELGRGGMGVVYRARHGETGRHVALKVLSPNIPRTADTVERFLREGQLAAVLSHPRSTFIYGAGEIDGQLYIAMELVPGRSLAKVLSDDGAVPVATAVDYVLDVTEGLASAHEAGVIHRDVKPSNCFLGEDGRVKVGDYGLSKSLVSDTDLTRTGVFLGTPQYAAPEQVRGGAVDRRTDIYSAAATLYALLTGRGPFTGDAAAVIAQIASDKPRPLRELRDDIPKELAAIISRALEKDPKMRFADMHQFRQALLPFATGGTSIAAVGRRLAAYFIDNVVTGMAGGIIGMLVVTVGLLTKTVDFQNPNPWFQKTLPLVAIMFVIAYFAIAEGCFGYGVGKRIMGLRVVDGRGESPGVARALLRAFLLPGMTSLPSLVGPMLVEPMQYSTGGNSILRNWLNTFAGWGATLLFLTTMRNRNGYRGIHEFLSGTRVVRPQTAGDAQRLSGCAVIAPVEVVDATASFGPYVVTGHLGYSGNARFFAAVDQSLQREVWIRVAPADEGIRAERVGITRPARPFWLNGGEVGDERWDALEAVNGAPIKTLIGDDERVCRLKWSQSVGILLQLSEELAAAADDGTLPADVSDAHVWVERDGRLKLLDHPLEIEPSGAMPTPDEPSDRPAQAVRLLRDLILRCARGQPLAAHAQTLVDRLQAMPDNAKTLHWSLEQFRDVAQRPSILRWDDRLGVLATSFGLEQGIFFVYAVSITTACLWLPGSLTIRLALAAVLSIAPPAVLGAWLRGGPVFRLTGISVRHRGRPASRLRCGWRGLIAWLPSMMAGVLLTITQTLGTEEVRAAGLSGEAGLMIFTTVTPLGFSFLYLVHITMALLTIAKPSRGVQDVLAGTSLVPR